MRAFWFTCLLCFIVGTQQQEIELRSINNVIKAILRNENPLLATMRVGALLGRLYDEVPVGEFLEDIDAAKKSMWNVLGITEDEIIKPGGELLQEIFGDKESVEKLLKTFLGVKNKPENKEVTSTPETVPELPNN